MSNSDQYATQIELAGFPGLFAEGNDRRRECPLVFIHGSFGTHRDFDNYLRFFAAAGFDCYAVSRRGRQGVPPDEAQGVRFQDYLDDTCRVLAALPREPIVIGHSLGGLIAQKVAEAGLCRGAVLLAPAPPAPLMAQVRSLPDFLPLMPNILLGRPFLPSPKGFTHLALNRVLEARRPQIIAGFVPESGIVFREMITGSIRVNASKVKCPILCVGAVDDRIISRRLIRLTARAYRAELREYPSHAHWLLDEPNWEEVASAVLAWLEKGILADHDNPT